VGATKGEDCSSGKVKVEMPAQDGKRAGYIKGLAHALGRVVGGVSYRIFVERPEDGYPSSNAFFSQGFVESNRDGKVRLQVPQEYRADMERVLSRLFSASPEGKLLVYGECNGSVTGRIESGDGNTKSQWDGPVGRKGPYTLTEWWSMHDKGYVFDTTIYEIKANGV
jgi:hypothetical protein